MPFITAMQTTARNPRLILLAAGTLFSGACEEDQDISDSDRVDEVDDVAVGGVQAEEAPIELDPIATLTLPNGNVLDFFATPDGWTGVHEYHTEENTISLLAMLGGDVTPAEIWRIAASEGEEMPPELLAASLLSGATQQGESRGVGGADSIVANTDPTASSSWCDGVGDDHATFDAFWCDAYGGGMGAGSWCGISNVMLMGASHAETTDPALHVIGAWCATGQVGFTVKWKPNAGGSWTYQINASHDLEGEWAYHHPSTTRIYEFFRYANSYSVADWGMSWRDYL